jgi:hypothetical protein
VLCLRTRIDSSREASVNLAAWPDMDPLEIAVEKIAESKRILDTLITSSESFDYPRAKWALGALQKMIRELGKTRAEFEELKRQPKPDLRVIEFPNERAG